MSRKAPSSAAALKHVPIVTGTSIDTRNPKMSSMNKHKKRNFKKYRGQGLGFSSPYRDCYLGWHCVLYAV